MLAKPGMSSGRAAGLVKVGSTASAASAPRIPTGTLMKKISRQLTYSTRYPPRVGPTAGATTRPSPYRPIAVPIFSLGTTRYSAVRQVTGMIPPGMACRIRNTIMLLRPQASPHSAEATEKPISEIR
jgi:hypothetical protein